VPTSALSAYRLPLSCFPLFDLRFPASRLPTCALSLPRPPTSTRAPSFSFQNAVPKHLTRRRQSASKILVTWLAAGVRCWRFLCDFFGRTRFRLPGRERDSFASLHHRRRCCAGRRGSQRTVSGQLKLLSGKRQATSGSQQAGIGKLKSLSGKR